LRLFRSAVGHGPSSLFLVLVGLARRAHVSRHPSPRRRQARWRVLAARRRNWAPRRPDFSLKLTPQRRLARRRALAAQRRSWTPRRPGFLDGLDRRALVPQCSSPRRRQARWRMLAAQRRSWTPRRPVIYTLLIPRRRLARRR